MVVFCSVFWARSFEKSHASLLRARSMWALCVDICLSLIRSWCSQRCEIGKWLCGVEQVVSPPSWCGDEKEAKFLESLDPFLKPSKVVSATLNPPYIYCKFWTKSGGHEKKRCHVCVSTPSMFPHTHVFGEKNIHPFIFGAEKTGFLSPFRQGDALSTSESVVNENLMPSLGPVHLWKLPNKNDGSLCRSCVFVSLCKKKHIYIYI